MSITQAQATVMEPSLTQTVCPTRVKSGSQSIAGPLQPLSIDDNTGHDDIREELLLYRRAVTSLLTLLSHCILHRSY